MKKLIVVGACVLQGWGVYAGRTAGSGSPENAEQEIRAIIHERHLAEERKDFAAYERLLADSLIASDEDGKVTDKKGVMAAVRGDSGPGRENTIDELTQFKVQVYGTTAVVNYLNTAHEAFDSQVISSDYRQTETYIKQDGTWKLVAIALSKIPHSTQSPAKINPAVYDDYVGNYEVGPHIHVRVTRQGDHLMEQWTDEPAPSEDLPYSESRFFQRGGAEQSVFIRDAKGKVTTLVIETPNGDLTARKTN